MPHVVINGKCDLDQIFKEIKPILLKTPDYILRTMDHYISNRKNAIVVETLVIEQSNKIQFFSLISKRDDGLVVRIYPGSEIDKTSGVKMILAELAKQILKLDRNWKIGKTNLNEYLKMLN